MTVPGGNDDSGLTVLGGEDDSGLTVLGGSDSGVTVLGGDDDSGLTVLGGDAGPVTSETSVPKATPLVYAAVAVAIAVFLIYLLYRHASVPLVAFIGILVLLLLGLTLHDGHDPAATAGPATGSDAPPIFHFEAAAPPYDSIFEAGGARFAPPVLGTILFLAGAIMLSSFLIVIALPKVRARLDNVPLLFLVVLGAIAAGIVVYAGEGVAVLPEGFYTGAYGVILVGAILFIVSLPRVQTRVKDVTFVLLAICGLAALGATWFAAGPPVEATGGVTGTGNGATATPWPLPAEQAAPSGAFYGGVFWVLLSAGALFLLTLPRIGARIRAYVAIDAGVKAFSWTGGFIAAAAVLAMGAMFHAADLPLWKLGVAIIAATIIGRYGWRFLRRYRGGPFLPIAHGGPVGRHAARTLPGAGQ